MNKLIDLGSAIVEAIVLAAFFFAVLVWALILTPEHHHREAPAQSVTNGGLQ